MFPPCELVTLHEEPSSAGIFFYRETESRKRIYPAAFDRLALGADEFPLPILTPLVLGASRG